MKNTLNIDTLLKKYPYHRMIIVGKEEVWKYVEQLIGEGHYVIGGDETTGTIYYI